MIAKVYSGPSLRSFFHRIWAAPRLKSECMMSCQELAPYPGGMAGCSCAALSVDHLDTRFRSRAEERSFRQTDH